MPVLERSVTRAAASPIFSLQCHCRDCQRQSGAAHVPAVRMPSAEFRIIKGKRQDLRREIRIPATTSAVSGVLWRLRDAALCAGIRTRPDLVGLRVTTFDDPNWFDPEANIFTKSAQPWDYSTQRCRNSRPTRMENRISAFAAVPVSRYRPFCSTITRR